MKIPVANPESILCCGPHGFCKGIKCAAFEVTHNSHIEYPKTGFSPPKLVDDGPSGFGRCGLCKR